MSELIDRQAAIGVVNNLIDRFERILRDIRESKGDDSVCGMCEYDGAYIGQSGDWCNECPGFDKDDCFKLSDECRKRWMGDIALPSVQPDHVADISKKVEEDCISRQMALKELAAYIHLIDKTMGKGTLTDDDCMEAAKSVLGEDELPAAQPKQLWIPSSEKPPKEGSYLVWMPFAPPENRIAVAVRCDGYWNIKTPISAWMPLPEPYRGGGE